MYSNPAEHIFHKLYMVRIPILATYSEEEMDIRGIPLNIIDGDNKESYNELTTVMLPISIMVENFTKGFPIRILTEEDVVEIHDIINKHLSAWKYHAQTSMNISASPDSDLIAMDKFAHEIFTNNRYGIVDSNQIQGSAYGGKAMPSLMNEVAPVKVTIDYNAVQRESLAPEVKGRSKYNLNDLLM